MFIPSQGGPAMPQPQHMGNLPPGFVPFTGTGPGQPVIPPVIPEDFSPRGAFIPDMQQQPTYILNQPMPGGMYGPGGPGPMMPQPMMGGDPNIPFVPPYTQTGGEPTLIRVEGTPTSSSGSSRSDSRGSRRSRLTHRDGRRDSRSPDSRRSSRSPRGRRQSSPSGRHVQRDDGRRPSRGSRSSTPTPVPIPMGSQIPQIVPLQQSQPPQIITVPGPSEYRPGSARHPDIQAQAPQPIIINQPPQQGGMFPGQGMPGGMVPGMGMPGMVPGMYPPPMSQPMSQAPPQVTVIGGDRSSSRSSSRGTRRSRSPRRSRTPPQIIMPSHRSSSRRSRSPRQVVAGPGGAFYVPTQGPSMGQPQVIVAPRTSRSHSSGSRRYHSPSYAHMPSIIPGASAPTQAPIVIQQPQQPQVPGVIMRDSSSSSRRHGRTPPIVVTQPIPPFTGSRMSRRSRSRTPPIILPGPGMMPSRYPTHHSRSRSRSRSPQRPPQLAYDPRSHPSGYRRSRSRSPRTHDDRPRSRSRSPRTRRSRSRSPRDRPHDRGRDRRSRSRSPTYRDGHRRSRSPTYRDGHRRSRSPTYRDGHRRSHSVIDVARPVTRVYSRRSTSYSPDRHDRRHRRRGYRSRSYSSGRRSRDRSPYHRRRRSRERYPSRRRSYSDEGRRRSRRGSRSPRSFPLQVSRPSSREGLRDPVYVSAPPGTGVVPIHPSGFPPEQRTQYAPSGVEFADAGVRPTHTVPSYPPQRVPTGVHIERSASRGTDISGVPHVVHAAGEFVHLITDLLLIYCDRAYSSSSTVHVRR